MESLPVCSSHGWFPNDNRASPLLLQNLRGFHDPTKAVIGAYDLKMKAFIKADKIEVEKEDDVKVNVSVKEKEEEKEEVEEEEAEEEKVEENLV